MDPRTEDILSSMKRLKADGDTETLKHMNRTVIEYGYLKEY